MVICCFAVRCPVVLLLCWACNSSNKLRLFLKVACCRLLSVLTFCFAHSLVYCCRPYVVLSGIFAVCVFFSFLVLAPITHCCISSPDAAFFAVVCSCTSYKPYFRVRSHLPKILANIFLCVYFVFSARLLCCCSGAPVSAVTTVLFS